MPQKVTFADDIASTSRQSVRRQAKRRALRKNGTPQPILKPPTREFPDVPDNWYFPVPCLRKSRKKIKEIPFMKLPGRNNVEVVQNLLFEQINYYNLDIGKVSSNVTKSKDVEVGKEQEQADTSRTATRTPLRATGKRNGTKKFGKEKEESTHLSPNVPLGGKSAADNAKDEKVKKAESKEAISTTVLPTPTGQCLLKKRRELHDKKRVSNEYKEHDVKVTKGSPGTRLPRIEGKTDKKKTEDRNKKEALQAKDLKLDKKTSKTGSEKACLRANGQKDRIDVTDNTRMTTRTKNDNGQVIHGTGRTTSKGLWDEGRKQTPVNSTQAKFRRGQTFQAQKEERRYSTQAKSRRDSSFQAQKEGKLYSTQAKSRSDTSFQAQKEERRYSTQAKSRRDSPFQAQKEEKPLSPELKPLRGQTASSLLHAMYNNNSILASM